MKVAEKDLKGYAYADGTHWHWGEKEVAIINDYTAEIEWCCRKSSLPDDVIKAIYDRKPKPSGKWVIEADRINMGATQGEILVRINGQTVACFGDEKHLKDGEWTSSYPDEKLGELIINTLWHKHDDLYHFSDKVKAVLMLGTEHDGKSAKTPEPVIYVETPVGIMHAYPSSDPDYPGIFVDLEREGKVMSAPLLLIDFSHTDFPECKNPEAAEKGVLVCRCWQDVRQEDYKEQDRTVFTGYDEFFAEQGNGNNP